MNFKKAAVIAGAAVIGGAVAAGTTVAVMKVMENDAPDCEACCGCADGDRACDQCGEPEDCGDADPDTGTIPGGVIFTPTPAVADSQ